MTPIPSGFSPTDNKYSLTFSQNSFPNILSSAISMSQHSLPRSCIKKQPRHNQEQRNMYIITFLEINYTSYKIIKAFSPSSGNGKYKLWPANKTFQSLNIFPMIIYSNLHKINIQLIFFSELSLKVKIQVCSLYWHSLYLQKCRQPDAGSQNLQKEKNVYTLAGLSCYFGFQEV